MSKGSTLQSLSEFFFSPFPSLDTGVRDFV